MKPTVIDNGFYLLDNIPHGVRGQPLYALRGGKWDYIIKRYRVPITPGNAGAMRLLGYDVPEVISQLPEAVPKGKSSLRLACADRLRPYQLEGVHQIEAWGGRVLLADSPGLGKTIQVLAWASAHVDLRPLIVVCPSCAKLNWKDEVSRWLPNEKCSVLSSTRVDIPDDPILIINYDILHHWVDELVKVKPKIIAIDESHRIRNWRTSVKKKTPDKYGRKGNYNLSTDSVLRLSQDCPHVIAMTGTPIINRPMEIFTSLHLLRPQIFPSRYEFGMRYADAKLDRWSGSLTFKGCANPEELNMLLHKTVMIRRLKEDVLKELPAKQNTVVHLSLSNRKEYLALESSFDINPLAKLTALRKTCAIGKVESAAEWIDDFLESGQKLVVFVHHRTVGEAIFNRYRDKAVAYAGGMNEKIRWDSVQKFQTDPKCQLFVGSISACGVAINLTAASNVAVLEFPWTNAVLLQATDRCHRIGQKNAVNVWFLTASDTIDEDSVTILIGKSGTSEAVLDNVHTEQEAMQAVLNAMQKRIHARNRVG